MAWLDHAITVRDFLAVLVGTIAVAALFFAFAMWMVDRGHWGNRF